MDDFGVLTEQYGLKAQGKSAPMAASKRPSTASSNAQARNFGFDSGLGQKPISHSSKSSWNSAPVDDNDDNDIFFQSNTKQKPQNSFGLGEDLGDIFGGFQKSTKQSGSSHHGNGGSSFDYDSIFSNSDGKSSSMNLYDDDVFGGMPGLKSSQNANHDDIFASFTSSKNQNAATDDLLGDFGGMGVKWKNSSRNGSWEAGQNEAGFDDLIPGFGGSSPPNNGKNIETTESTFKSADDPFLVFESASNPAYASSGPPADPLDVFSNFNKHGGTKPSGSSNSSSLLRPPPKPGQVLRPDKVKSSGASSIGELEDFAMGRMHNKASRYKEAEDAAQKTQQKGEDDLESFFGTSYRSNSVPKSRATTLDPIFEAKIQNREQKASTKVSSSTKKASSAPMTNMVDDLSSIFGAASMFGEFEEVEGESEERRRARLGRHQRTQDRVARAVTDMNQRDLQTQYEQEERRRIAETLDFEIKRWAMGKEGNMRALLSSLQQVLWPECGWDPVSLTDLITSTAVKKVYRKATLFVHPDKVQQKGATLEQKYIAEKVFDILKEAWNKFNKEELA
ncbi:hypothetical protein SLA2020_494660 [Shorea laevis]